MNIQDLIDAAPPGGTVNVPAGTYNEQLTINKPLMLQGLPSTTEAAVIDATGLGSIATIQILSSNVIVKGLTIQNGPLHGIKVGDETATNLTDVEIIDNHILNHGNAGIITNNGASMIIDNNIIENNGQGTGFNRGGIILYPHGATSIVNNTISNNVIEGIFARESNAGLIIENNTIENHSNSCITLAWDERNVSITNNLIRTCGVGNYDEQGGIVIIQSMAETIQGNTIEDCSYSGIFWGWMPTTGMPPSQILIDSNKIKNSERDGIYLFSQGAGGWIPPDIYPLEPKIENNTLISNGRAGVYISNLYYYSPGNANPIIHTNDIIDNEWGVFNATAQIVDAINNWWGDNSGPFHPTLNPGGTGNPVSNNVDFTPWLTRQPVIQITKCRISALKIEEYCISILSDKTSEMKLAIRIIGDVCLDIDGAKTMITFQKLFSRTFIIEAPKSNNMVPSLNFVPHCQANLAGNMINIKIELFIVVNIRDRYSTLLIPSRACSPRQNYIDKYKILKKEVMTKRYNGQYNRHDCLSVEIVLDTFRFKEELFHNIDILNLS